VLHAVKSVAAAATSPTVSGRLALLSAYLARPREVSAAGLRSGGGLLASRLKPVV